MLSIFGQHSTAEGGVSGGRADHALFENSHSHRVGCGGACRLLAADAICARARIWNSGTRSCDAASRRKSRGIFGPQADVRTPMGSDTRSRGNAEHSARNRYALCGVLTGEWLRSNRNPKQKAAGMLAAGGAGHHCRRGMGSLVSYQQEPMDQLLCTVHRRLRSALPGNLLLGHRCQVTSRLVDQAVRHLWVKRNCGLRCFRSTGRDVWAERPGLPAHIRAGQAAGFRIAALFADGRRGLLPAGLVDVSQENLPEGLTFLFKGLGPCLGHYPSSVRLKVEVADEPVQVIGMQVQ